MAGEDGQLSDAELGELAAFADGSLPPDRRAQVEARIERSPQLQALVAEQRSALAAVRALDAPAPGALHAHLRADSHPRETRTGRRLALAGGLAAAALVAGLWRRARLGRVGVARR